MKTYLQKDSIFKIGKVISVEGRTIKVEVDKAKNSSHLLYNGDLLRNISVNSYIKITKGFIKIIGKVEGEVIVEDRQYSEKNYTNERKKIKRILIVSLLGFFSKRRFERGIKELPLINNECFLLEIEEFDAIHNFVKKGDEPITIGTLTHENGREISLGVNDLFASHIGIFGNTGSGKSYTLAKIYRELFSKFIKEKKFTKNAQFYFIDFNGEYVEDNAILEKEYKNIYRLNTITNEREDKFPISKSHIEDPDFWALVLEATEKTQKPFLKRAIIKKPLLDNIKDIDSLKKTLKDFITKIIYKKDDKLRVNVIIDLLTSIGDSLTNSNINDISNNIWENIFFNSTSKAFFCNDPDNNGYSYNTDTVVSTVTKILDEIKANEIKDDHLTETKLKIVLQYYNEIIHGFSNIEHLSPLLKRMNIIINDLKKIIDVVVDEYVPEKNITVISFRNVNLQTRKMLPLLICKQLYEEKKKSKEQEKYLNIIIDEAHNILSSVSERESETWKDYRLETFEEIIKEGRKFGVFLTIASQRPYDISATIVSQLHNFFLHRLINNSDINAIEKTLSYLDRLSFETLPILPTGTCILAGLSAQVPVLIDIGEIDKEFEPDNKTMKLINNWKD